MSLWPETRVSLIRRLADRNDADAWAFFEDNYQQAVYRFARSRGLQPNDAMDVVQEVLMAVHKAAANWKPSGQIGSFRAWLSEAARRVTLQITRQRSRIGQGVGGSGFALEIVKIASEVSASEDDDRRWSFYCAATIVQKEVSPQHWMAFWLTAVEGKSADEVASELSMKLGTVYSAKCRVLAKIKAAIQEATDIVSSSPGDVQ
jgi:RNA polymerase sigma-70 factor, ECF subfamily